MRRFNLIRNYSERLRVMLKVAIAENYVSMDRTETSEIIQTKVSIHMDGTHNHQIEHNSGKKAKN